MSTVVEHSGGRQVCNSHYRCGSGLTASRRDSIRIAMRLFSRFLVVPFLLASAVGLAHHSNVMFDKDKEISLKGTVKE